MTRLELTVDRKGVPTGGLLGLEQGPMKEDGEITFEFADVAQKKRIDVIRSTLKSANLTIRPELRFHFETHKGFLLPARAVFDVPPGDLSPSLGRMMGGTGMRMQSALLFTDYKVKGKKKR